MGIFLKNYFGGNMKTKFWKVVCLLGVSVSILFCFTGCSEKKDSTDVSADEVISKKKTPDDTFVYGGPNEPFTLAPYDANALTSWLAGKVIHDNLVEMDPDTGDFVGVLAESWDYSDDYLTLTLHIRDGVEFQNGVELSSEDVLFTLEQISKTSRFAANYKCIDFSKCELVDDLTLKIVFNETYAPFFAFLAHPSAGIVCKSYFEEVGPDLFSQKPMGTGPFTFKEWISGDRITLVRNDSYWGDKPAYKNLVIRFIPEDTTRMIEFETGGVDAIGNLSGNDMERMMKGSVENARLESCTGQKVYRWCMFRGNEVLNNQKVREAISLALDFEGITQSVFGPAGQLAKSILPPDSRFYKEVGTYKYDPELAKKLMAEAGYPDGFEVNTYTVAGDEEKICEIAQSMLAEIGIKMNIEIAELATLIKTEMSGECNMGIVKMTATTRDPDQTYNTLTADTSLGISRVPEKALDDLIAIGRTSIEDSVRADAYAKADQYVYDNYIQFPILVNVVGYAIKDYIDYFDADTGNIPDLAKVTFK